MGFRGAIISMELKTGTYGLPAMKDGEHSGNETKDECNTERWQIKSIYLERLSLFAADRRRAKLMRQNKLGLD